MKIIEAQQESGHSSYEDLLEQGFVTAIVNYCFLDGALRMTEKIFSLDELIKSSTTTE